MSEASGMWRAPIVVVITVAVLAAAAFYLPDQPGERTPAPLAGSGWEDPGRPAPPEGLISAQFTLADARYSLLVPGAAETQRPTAERPYFTMVPLPHGRMVRFFRLAAGGEDDRYDRSMKLGNGAVLRYRIAEDVGGGSGGQEAELTGQLQIEGRTLAVTCHDQGEWSRHPDWCLAYLHHLRLEGAQAR
jgi:hypothetical protein